jgi:hypothetical protein
MRYAQGGGPAAERRQFRERIRYEAGGRFARGERTAVIARDPPWPTANPHVMVTQGTKAARSSASTAFLSRVLDDYGSSSRTIRSIRLLDLVNTVDPKLVAAAFGMDPQATLIYLTEHVDPGRETSLSRAHRS